MKKLLVFMAVAGLFSCKPINPAGTQNAQPKADSAVATAVNAGGDTVVATVGDEKILASEIDKELKAELFDLEDEIFKIKKRKIDEVVNDKLLDLEAKKRNVSVKQLMTEEVDSKFVEPNEAELKDFFEKNKERIGQNFEEAKQKITNYLGQMKKNDLSEAFYGKLRGSYNVQVTLKSPEHPVYDVKINADDPFLGPENAKVVLVEYTDFQCPFCKRSEDTVKEVLKAYDGKIKFVYKSFPLGFHPKGRRAAEAALCARDQGKFWEYHTEIFNDTKTIDDNDLVAKAERLKLDLEKFKPCFENRTHKDRVDQDIDEASKIGVRGTPAFFINGKKISGAQQFNVFKDLIDSELQAID